MRLFTMLLIALTIVSMFVCAVPLAAAGEPPPLAIPDFVVPGVGATIAAALVWGAKRVTAAMDHHAQTGNALISRLVDITEKSLNESRQSREAMDAARRAFASANAIPGHTKPIDSDRFNNPRDTSP